MADTAPTANPIPSSSPAFGTPAHPIIPHRSAAIPAPAAIRPATILPVLLPPATLRPLAFRTFTKKHGLTLTSSALAALATFIGRHCGSGWREDGLAEGVLEEVARSWKKAGGGVIVDGDGETLRTLLKTLEGCMVGGKAVLGKSALSRQSSFAFGENAEQAGARPTLSHESSFGLSKLAVGGQDGDDDEHLTDPREWIKVVDAFDQPRLVYNILKKQFETSATKASLFPSPSQKTEYFRQRYQITHQRILRNDSFQPSAFTSASSSSNPQSLTKITQIANLLGRGGSNHLLLGLLTISPTSTLALSDLTGTIALDLRHARPIPADGAWFGAGMIVLVDGVYEEEYSTAAGAGSLGNTGGVGGTVGGKFIALSVAHPPCERRAHTVGGNQLLKREATITASGAAPFGWTDFLGVGSMRASGTRMHKLQQRLLGPSSDRSGAARIAIAAQVALDVPGTLSALRAMLASYASDEPDSYPLAIVLMGDFCSVATMAGVSSAASGPSAGGGGASIEYKEGFDALAAVLADFPALLARTTLVFVPGDNDAWASAASAGAATPVPRRPVPDLFTTRVRRVVAEANRDHGRKGHAKEGEAIWATNPARLSIFGPAGEIVLFRDDIAGRLRRSAVTFGSPDAEEQEDHEPDAEPAPSGVSGGANRLSEQPSSPHPTSAAESHTDQMDVDPPSIDPDILLARRLVRTLVAQSHLSPFPLSMRPVHWAYGSALSLYPLPSALVVADAEVPAFALVYDGCCVVNPGPLAVAKAKSGWVELVVGDGSEGMRGKVLEVDVVESVVARRNAF